jgi:hypothetical protein
MNHKILDPQIDTVIVVTIPAFAVLLLGLIFSYGGRKVTSRAKWIHWISIEASNHTYAEQ